MLKLSVVWKQIRSFFAFSTHFKTIHFFIFKVIWGESLLPAWPFERGLTLHPPLPHSLGTRFFPHKGFFPARPAPTYSLSELGILSRAGQRAHEACSSVPWTWERMSSEHMCVRMQCAREAGVRCFLFRCAVRSVTCLCSWAQVPGRRQGCEVTKGDGAFRPSLLRWFFCDPGLAEVNI